MIKMTTEISKPLVSSEDRYAIDLAVGRGCVSLVQGYPTEESLENGYKTWVQFAEERRITKPVRVMFVDADDAPTTYSNSKGRCLPTDSELVEKIRLN